jgi:biopolymer transport protein ExbB
MMGLRVRLKTVNLAAGREYCKAGKGAVARVMYQAVGSLGRGHEQVAQRLNTAIEVERVEMERNLSVLGTMSNIAPLLGLFGTVVGIIRAFADIARTGSGGSSVVAMGVSEALMTTAAGIVVAVIATCFFNLFVRRIRTRTVELEDAREEFFAIVSAIPARGQAAPARSNSQAPGGHTTDELVSATLLS